MGLKTKANGPRDSTEMRALPGCPTSFSPCVRVPACRAELPAATSTLMPEPSPRDYAVGEKQRAGLASDSFIFNRVLLPVRR